MSRYLSLIKQSYSVAFADFVRMREAEGMPIIKMQTGDPDFATHANVVEAAIQALQKGETKYCDSKGLLSLRKALAEKLAKQNNIQISAENILVTHGAVHGISIAIKSLVNQGDECIILEPFWRSYEANIILCGGIPVIIKTNQKKGFQLESQKILEKITDKTKLIIINTPNNPSGAVYSKNELILLAKGAAAKGVYIISDEVYESLVFDSHKHYSIASDKKIFDSIISVFSFSKTHAMTGWRIGYLVASKTIIDEVLKLSQFSITSLSPYSQAGAFKALTDKNAAIYAETMRKEYEDRKNFFLTKIKGTWLEKESSIPEGTFYILINTSRFCMPSLELAKKMLDFSHVSFTPGIAFGDTMDGYLRLCLATSIENIELATQALLNFEKEFAIINIK